MKRQNGEVKSIILDYFASFVSSGSCKMISVNDICQATGCSRSSFYYHFPSGIPSLVNAYLEHSLTSPAISLYRQYGSHQTILYCLTFLNDNRPLYLAIKHSFTPETLHATFDEHIHHYAYLFLKSAALHDGLSIPEGDLSGYASIFTALTHGIMDAMLNNSPQFDPLKHVDRIYSSFIAIYQSMASPYQTDK